MDLLQFLGIDRNSFRHELAAIYDRTLSMNRSNLNLISSQLDRNYLNLNAIKIQIHDDSE